jgi:hypothetical protein
MYSLGSHTLGLLFFIEKTPERKAVVVLFFQNVVRETLAVDLLSSTNEVIAQRLKGDDLAHSSGVITRWRQRLEDGVDIVQLQLQHNAGCRRIHHCRELEVRAKRV